MSGLKELDFPNAKMAAFSGRVRPASHQLGF